MLRYAAPFRARFAIKLSLLLFSILPLMLLPWPGKIVIDHVIEAVPLDPAAYPFFVRPLLAPLAGADPLTILGWTVAFQLLLLVVVGAFGANFREQDTADAYLASGHDTQTRTENEANAGFSLSGGLLGWLDFRFTMRLTQDLNHHYRSSLFERVHALPMTAFDDERIGDAVYRVMIDTPVDHDGVPPHPADADRRARDDRRRRVRDGDVGAQPPGAGRRGARDDPGRAAREPAAGGADAAPQSRQPRGGLRHDVDRRGRSRAGARGAEPRRRRPATRPLRSRLVALVRRLPRRRAHQHGGVPARLRAGLAGGRLGADAHRDARDRRAC